jgi:hypothetical protein
MQCDEQNDLLPKAGDNCDEGLSFHTTFIKNVFYGYGDKAWKYTAALLGVHGLGGSSKENTGMDGLWSTLEM